MPVGDRRSDATGNGLAGESCTLFPFTHSSKSFHMAALRATTSLSELCSLSHDKATCELAFTPPPLAPLILRYCYPNLLPRRCERAGIPCTYSKRRPPHPARSQQQREGQQPGHLHLVRHSASGAIQAGGALPFKRWVLHTRDAFERNPSVERRTCARGPIKRKRQGRKPPTRWLPCVDVGPRAPRQILRLIIKRLRARFCRLGLCPVRPFALGAVFCPQIDFWDHAAHVVLFVLHAFFSAADVMLL